MAGRGAALLLLVLGACAAVPAAAVPSTIAYSLTVNDYGGQALTYFPISMTGTLFSDENCGGPPPTKASGHVAEVSQFCTPVANVPVTISLTPGSVGTVSPSPVPTTDANGSFTFQLSSTDTGEDSIGATATVAGVTVNTSTQVAVTWIAPVTAFSPAEQFANDTVRLRNPACVP